MNVKYIAQLSRRNFLFWLSRKLDYPLLPPDLVQINFTFRCNLRCKMCSMHEQMEYLQSQGRQVEIDLLLLHHDGVVAIGLELFEIADDLLALGVLVSFRQVLLQ